VTNGFHPPLEEYLETIHSLNEEGTPVIQARIAQRLHRSAPSVSEMLDRLQDDGYIDRSGRKVALTDKGLSLAESVVRKHRLAERLLVDVIGLEWHKAHIEAGRWEHVISDDVERRLVELLGNPTTCPHGNPIPGSPPSLTPPSQVSLADAHLGQTVRLERVNEEVELDMNSLEFLDRNGLRPGAAACVRAKAADGTLTIDVEGTSVDVGPELAQQIFVAST
jgi:DtxR family transcriptional regulator, Mn-dependent transcriptional regulator